MRKRTTSLVGLKLRRVSSNNSRINSRSTTDESGTSLPPGIVRREAMPDYRLAPASRTATSVSDLQALSAVRTAVEMSDNPTLLADLAYVQARRGETKDALETLRRAKRQPWEAFNIARAYVALGEPDSAFAWLERSSWRWPHRAVRSDPALDPLRSDPRFAQLARRIEREMGIQ